ncbi:hypothetical protein PRV_00990 [Mycoplasma parvum str. Indiana]|uniref:Uncharacterized protein n=1 Tax=Mycoplasma parvum str. Indiana TaxID=1403316 RepID=U5NFG4_9MOLU|nr:hypothetical protein PRV_00990 [Mycoplasma parvum str. Indiana]
MFYSFVPFSIGGSSLFFINSENLNSLISRISISGGGDSPLFNFNSSKNELKMDSHLIPKTEMKLQQENLKTSSLKEIETPENLKINQTNLNENQKIGNLKETVGNIVIEIDREAGVKTIEKEQEEKLSKVRQELQKHSNNFKEVVLTAKPPTSSESVSSAARSRGKRDSDSQTDMSSKKLTKEVRNSVGVYYQKHVELKDKKHELQKRLKNIEENAKDIEVKQERNDKYVDTKVFKSLEQIGWGTKNEIDFEKLIRSNFWDGGINPYGNLLTFEQWNQIVENFKKLEKEIKEIEASSSTKACSLAAFFIRSSHLCFRKRDELREQQKALKKLLPLVVKEKLLREMGLINGPSLSSLKVN